MIQQTLTCNKQCFQNRYFAIQNYFHQPSIPDNQAGRGGSAPLETRSSRARVIQIFIKEQQFCKKKRDPLFLHDFLLYRTTNKTLQQSKKRVRSIIYFLLQFPTATEDLENTCAIAIESSPLTLVMESQHSNRCFKVSVIFFEQYQNNFQHIYHSLLNINPPPSPPSPFVSLALPYFNRLSSTAGTFVPEFTKKPLFCMHLK